MKDVTDSLHKALNTIDGLTEFELDRSEKIALQKVLPLFESSYALLTTLEDMIDMTTIGEVELNKIKDLIKYAKSGFKNENKEENKEE